MKERRTNKRARESAGHPLKSLEPDFQVVIAAWQEQRGYGSLDVQGSLIRIRSTLVNIAGAIFRHWDHKDAFFVAEEVAHDWIIRMWRVGLKNYTAGEPFYAYAYVAFTRLCVSLARRERRRRVTRATGEWADRCRSGPQLVEQIAIGREVRAAVESLSEAQREAIVLLHLEDLSGKEASQRCGVSPAILRQRAFRARRTLEKNLRHLA